MGVVKGDDPDAKGLGDVRVEEEGGFVESCDLMGVWLVFVVSIFFLPCAHFFLFGQVEGTRGYFLVVILSGMIRNTPKTADWQMTTREKERERKLTNTIHAQLNPRTHNLIPPINPLQHIPRIDPCIDVETTRATEGMRKRRVFRKELVYRGLLRRGRCLR